VKPLHLVQRFVRALRPGPPRPAEAAWAESLLTPPELALWLRLPNHERRYTIRVARHVQRALAGTSYEDDRWPAVALLHDVGKLDAGLGVSGRTLATLAGVVRPRTRSSGGRFGRYLRHDEIGEQMLRAAGSRDEAAVWAGAHHHPERWGSTVAIVPLPVADALAAADNA
jgi:HD domain